MASVPVGRTMAVVRLLTALAMAGSIVWQVTDRVANNVFRPGEYFAYFTIDTSMVAAVALAVAAYFAWTGRPETKVLTIVRLSVVTYALVVSIVYNALLRGMPPAAVDGDYKWPQAPNEVLHVWAAVFILLDWLISQPLVRLRIRAIFWTLLFPLAWAVFSIVRGIITGWWPYWFIDPNDPGGIPQMVMYIVGIMVFMIVMAFLSLMLSRATHRLLVRNK